ncbi:MAG: UDP-N-acetylmuramoyl-L-alanine--D-glutamate ligase [Gemmatimonadota bacterium]|nr:UDP-N-acetylmuramoyl-L-alanine--D-glutamate ligase [Gemmatimonadota bacterium]
MKSENERETIAVIGLGASGDAAARLALAKGARVHVTDASSEDAVAARGAALRDLGAEIRLGGHELEKIAAADTVVVSPGIPPTAAVLAALRARGVDWISEPEFASRFIQGPLTIVTGTNGKTTTAALSAHLLREAGVDVALGGNIGGSLGPPASTLAANRPSAERFVLELSSFQLADIRDLTPDVGVMTNLGVDHMDRYATVEDYHRDKRRLFDAGDDNTTWVLNGDDGAVLEMARGVPGPRLTFSLETSAVPGAWLDTDRLMVDTGRGARRVAEAADVRLVGRHNIANTLAALLAAAASGASLDGARRALRSFAPLPHRLEPVGTVDGVRWVNDSKATNVAAAAGALGSLNGPVVLLVGGTDKGEDFGDLADAMRGRTRAVVAYGAAGPRAAAEMAGRGPPVECVDGTFEEVVEAGRRFARAGDTLLLAPACSSFDMFENYEARGAAFRALASEAARAAR